MGDLPLCWRCPACHREFDHDPDEDMLLPDHPTHSAWSFDTHGWENCFGKPVLGTFVPEGASPEQILNLVGDVQRGDMYTGSHAHVWEVLPSLEPDEYDAEGLNEPDAKCFVVTPRTEAS